MAAIFAEELPTLDSEAGTRETIDKCKYILSWLKEVAVDQESLISNLEFVS